jgi:hypothetical protein
VVWFIRWFEDGEGAGGRWQAPLQLLVPSHTPHHTHLHPCPNCTAP